MVVLTLRSASGRRGCTGGGGGRLSTGDVLAYECRAGMGGRTVLRDAPLSAGEPARDNVADSWMNGISSVAALGGSHW